MRVVSVPADVAWEALYGGRDVLNLPTPAPPPVCERCMGSGEVYAGQSTVDGPYPCDGRKGCGGTGVAPLRVALHATNRCDLDSIINFARMAWQSDEGLGSKTRPLHGEGVETFVPFDHVVAVVTITGSHPDGERGTCTYSRDEDVFRCSDWATPGSDTDHWQVADVVAVDPVPWAGSDGVLPVETSRAIEAQL